MSHARRGFSTEYQDAATEADETGSRPLLGGRASQASRGSVGSKQYSESVRQAIAGVQTDSAYPMWSSLIMIPEHNPFVKGWVALIFILMFVVFYYEPYAIAVLGSDPGWALVLNRFLDVVFTFDIVLQFFLAYPLSSESASASLWEKDPPKIVARYCGVPFTEGGQAGWFWVDLLSILPGWVRLFLEMSYSEARSGTRFGKFLVAQRVLRFLRVRRLALFDSLITEWHIRSGFPFYVVELCKFFLITTLTVHWMACIWIVLDGKVVVGKVTYHSDQESWLSALINDKGDVCTPDASADPECVWSIAIYWSMMTLTTTGYGDIAPQNVLEYIVCTFFMLFAAYTWAYIVGKIVTILSNLSPGEQRFQETADGLRGLMVKKGLPQELQVRLRKYLHEAKISSLRSQQQQLTERCLSAKLQRDMVLKTKLYTDFKASVWWAKDLSDEALLELVCRMEPISFGPNENTRLPGALILVRRGLMACNGRVLRRGHAWGQCDILLETQSIINGHTPRTLTHADVMVLHKSCLAEVCENFPRADKRIRRAQIRSAVFRAFVQAAKNTVRQRSCLRESGDRGRADGTIDSFRSPRKTMTVTLGKGAHQRDFMSMMSSRDDEDFADQSLAITSFARPGQPQISIRRSSKTGGSHDDEVSMGELLALVRKLEQRHTALNDKVGRLQATVQAARLN